MYGSKSKKLSVSVSFENELAQYLMDMAEIQNKTIAEIVNDLVEEELEASKLSEDDEIDEVDIELAKLSLERDARGDEEITSEDVDWDRILSAKTIKSEDISCDTILSIQKSS
jgi:RHH-type rel operon transcriptional repressor/antitoxin RelB